MYKPSRRMLEKGKILNRSEYFHYYGAEYTFVLKDYDLLWNRIAALLEPENKHIRYKVFPDRPVMAIVGRGWRYEFYRTAHLDDNVRYIGYFSDWEEYGTTPALGDWMNQAQTIVELVIAQIDPCAWVRDLPMKRHVTNGIGSSPEKWTAGPPQTDLTREEAAEKKLDECYLADRIRAFGMTITGGADFAAANQIPENPMIALRVQQNLDKAAKKEAELEEKKNKPVPVLKKFCDKCGYETEPGSKFCSKCGAPVKKTIAEKKAEEKTLQKYPMLFPTQGGQAMEPYIHVNLDESLNIVEEPGDHGFYSNRVKGIVLKSMPKGAQKYTLQYSSESNEDTALYVSDSRIVVINREYNKNNAGKWRGYGGLIDIGVAAALNAAGRAAMKAKRGNSALAGQLRYEWISGIYYKRKEKMMDSEQIRFTFKDLERTQWYITLNLIKEVDSGALANNIMQRCMKFRSEMLDERDEEMNAFLEKYRSGSGRLPISSDPTKMSGESVPVYYFATKGMPYRPDTE